MDAMELARRFGLGRARRLSDAPLARGKQGLVWRLDTADGSWAVKVPLHPSDEAEAEVATSFQEAAYAAGVPTPQVRRTTEGSVFATIAGTQVRVYEWVDLMPPDSMLDPALVGAVVAAIHRVQPPTSARWTRGITNRSAPNAGTIWSGSCARRERRSPADWPICVMSSSRSSPGSSLRR